MVSTPLTNISQIGFIPTIGENKIHVPNHQPVIELVGKPNVHHVNLWDVVRSALTASLPTPDT